MDKRKYNGGHPTNGGRKPKADEQKLIEKLTPLEPIAFKALDKALKDDQWWAVKLFMEYRYGKPKQTIDQNINELSIVWKENKTYWYYPKNKQ